MAVRVNKVGKGSVKMMLAIGAGLLLAPAIASAQVHDFRGERYARHEAPRYEASRFDRGRDYGRREEVRIDFGVGRPAPAYETQRVWVQPVYRTVVDRVWREPVYQEVCDRVWVEPVYEIRETVRNERHRQVIVRDRVLVSPGHYQERRRQVLVAPGRWETIERQELVAAGHWEYRTTEVCAPEPAGWNFSFGYGSRR